MAMAPAPAAPSAAPAAPPPKGGPSLQQIQESVWESQHRGRLGGPGENGVSRVFLKGK